METNTLDKRVIGTVSVRSIVTFVISILAFAAISWIYFYPSDVQGDVLQQNDVLQGAANGQEAKVFNESHEGEVTRWTNSLFGGMPTFQIAPSYESNSMINTIGKVLTLGFPQPVSWVVSLETVPAYSGRSSGSAISLNCTQPSLISFLSSSSF